MTGDVEVIIKPVIVDSFRASDGTFLNILQEVSIMEGCVLTDIVFGRARRGLNSGLLLLWI